MLIAPIIFCTVVIGIAHVGNLKAVGRIGVKALIYFEVVTTKPAVANPPTAKFLLNIIPVSTVSAFAENTPLQTLFFAALFGHVDRLSHLFFMIVGWIMRLAPLGALSAMAYIVGQYGISSLGSSGKLIAACYLAALLFILILAATARYFAGVNL